MNGDGHAKSKGDAYFKNVIAEYFCDGETDSALRRQELLQRHPDLVDELLAFFADHDRKGGVTATMAAEANRVPGEPRRESERLSKGGRQKYERPLSDAATPSLASHGGDTIDGQDPPPKGEGNDDSTKAQRTLPFAADIQGFDGYELVEEIGHGGMGVVYKAYQKSLGRFVALKIIRAAEFADEVAIQRFCQEAQAAASLDHPNIVPVYEVGSRDGIRFFSMGFVEGRSLADRIADGPLEPHTAAKLTQTIAEAVHYAHSNGVIHRDLKPSNVLLDDQENPRVADFGLAKREGTDAELTVTGQVVGTPGYMSPEQANGDQVTRSTDVYSLGAMLYALLVCRPPFCGKSSLDVLRQVREESPVPLRTLDSTIPRDLDAITLKCLDKSPDHRYRSANEMADDLERFLHGEATTARLPSYSERILRWCRRPRRIDDVAILTLVLASIFAVWNLVGLLALATGLLPTDSVARSLLIVGLDFAGFVVYLCLGLATFSGRLSVLWTGLTVSIGVLVFTIACLFGWIYFDGGGWLKDPVVRLPVFLFFSTMASIQVAAYLVALVAGCAARRGVPRG